MADEGFPMNQLASGGAEASGSTGTPPGPDDDMHDGPAHVARWPALAVALESIRSALDHASSPRSQYLGLWFCEQTLENEHREWLRLMLEAEWF